MSGVGRGMKCMPAVYCDVDFGREASYPNRHGEMWRNVVDCTSVTVKSNSAKSSPQRLAHDAVPYVAKTSLYCEGAVILISFPQMHTVAVGGVQSCSGVLS